MPGARKEPNQVAIWAWPFLIAQLLECHPEYWVCSEPQTPNLRLTTTTVVFARLSLTPLALNDPLSGNGFLGRLGLLKAYASDASGPRRYCNSLRLSTMNAKTGQILSFPPFLDLPFKSRTQRLLRTSTCGFTEH